jgi:hypothetical protein
MRHASDHVVDELLIHFGVLEAIRVGLRIIDHPPTARVAAVAGSH